MPDLTIEIMQQCQSFGHTREYPSSRGKEVYHTSLTFCSCDAWRYYKGHPAQRTCKHHQQFLKDACLWHEQWSDEEQTPEHQEKNICPRCDGPTEPVRVAV